MNTTVQTELLLHPEHRVRFRGRRRAAIESEAFPFEHLGTIARAESWRKEISRPTYHLHKWWAKRLGSVFRGILLGCLSPDGSNLMESFYSRVAPNNTVIFDPFMGSGTTIGEALKLGSRAIGRDINPVAYRSVLAALGDHSRADILETFAEIERDVADEIKRYYQARTASRVTTDVLYYFWVKVVPCPSCENPVDLFSSYVFARHAYPSRNPEAKAVCPHCRQLNTVLHDAETASCATCRETVHLKSGPAGRVRATCPSCEHDFPIAKTVRDSGAPPAHRIYAKLVLQSDGAKKYLAADDYDNELYRRAVRELKNHPGLYPKGSILPGYNTNQVLNYCYTSWEQMFNARQLLCLGQLAARIRAIPSESIRSVFACLFSGTLEFNNMFASFKGEGTGAVRHMFSHHILKPERTPLEANPWGTHKSSGSFSTLFRSRLLRLLDYADDPFEIRIARKTGRDTTTKLRGLSHPPRAEIASTYKDFAEGFRLYLSAGDSSSTDLPDGSVDYVVTDPPFFDNVHYSQLADFFYVWLRHILGARDTLRHPSTRQEDTEVQDSDAARFTSKLGGVFAECYRVLRRSGLLVFTYHHSRPEGWQALLEALQHARFVVVQAFPIKSEMSVAQPKHQAKEPIDIDIVVVCRKRTRAQLHTVDWGQILSDAMETASRQLERLRSVGQALSRNDVRVVLKGRLLVGLSQLDNNLVALDALTSNGHDVEEAIDNLAMRYRMS